ncbi:hypothetical protein [Streptomyces pacificus]|uniref:hypothetical protein n=1 Tax=Streptomyces pacificus TaxID=2705029 RepID=UPI001564398C|nr:hypothetical protein [Streptomyces pacificus]
MPAALLLLILVCWTVGASQVPVPSLTGGLSGAQLAYFTPVLVVVTTMYCLDRNLRGAESTAVVPVHLLDTAALVLTVVLAHLAGFLVGMDIARNITVLLALALVTRRLANEATATAAGLLLLLLNLILGRAYDPGGHASPTWWALTLYPAGSLPAWVVALVLFALALAIPGARHRA